jgi:hydroxyacylglutathione hydrolase
MVERIIVGLLQTNAYLLSVGKKGCIIIDPGADHQHILGRIQQMGLTPLGIVLTHGHLDHVAAVGPIVKHFLQQGLTLKVAIHEKDSQYLGEQAREAHWESFRSLGPHADSLFDTLFAATPEPSVLLHDNDSLFDTAIKAIHTPGHTEGSISLYIEADNMLFSGDTLFLEGVGRTDFPGGNSEKLKQSIKTKLFDLPEHTRVFPGHGPHTTIEREKKHNPFV